MHVNKEFSWADLIDQEAPDKDDYEVSSGGDFIWWNKEFSYEGEVLTLTHRKGFPARIWKGGTKEWFEAGRFHREGGPAVEWDNGNREWFLNGFHHREDGPAIINKFGYLWFLNGRRLSFDDWLSCCWENLSEERKEELIFNGFEWK